MKTIKDSEYSFTTVTVGYLAITSVDGHKDIEVRVEGEYDHQNGSSINKRIIEEGSDDILYDAGLILINSEIKDMDKLLDHLDNVLDDH